MNGISGKRVLIVGGCGDIGRAVAGRFLATGAKVMLADLMTQREGEVVARGLGAEAARYTPCDVVQKTSVDASVQAAVAAFGGLDVAVCCAGTVANAPILELSEQSWQQTLQVNLTGSLLVGQAAAKAMLANEISASGSRGALLFTGSWVQAMPWPQGGSYCASKAGQEMLVKVMAQELAAHRITCNIVAPGIVYAGLSKTIYDRDEQYRRRVDQTVPLERLSTADEVAGSFLFLASDDGAYITGTTLLVDGGASLVRRE
jgi:NAD(P)-dependent dehydrogenase (short-subunit alcohol dehydrogenase family)